MKPGDYHNSRILVMKAAICLVLAGLSSSCFGFSTTYSDKGKTEVGGILKMLSVPLKDGGHADIRFEKLRRSFRTRALWFQGAGGEQASEDSQYYLIVRGTAKLQSGLIKEFTWIGPYEKHWSVPYLIPQWLVISGNDVFIEYAAIPTAPNLTCNEVVKRKRYKETRKWDFDDLKDPLVKYGYTYKWPVEYVWEDVTKETFEQAARTGVVVSLDSNWDTANDVCYAWSDDCFTRCSEQLDGPKQIRFRFDDHVAILSVEETEQTLKDHPEVLHTDIGRKALHKVIAWLDPKRKIRKDNDARRMLALLYKFNPEINAVDTMNRTPLHVAVELNLGRDIVDELVRRGGRILYPPCGFREAVLARYPELAKNDIIREIGDDEGWIDDDAYQVWGAGTYSSDEDRDAVEKKIMHQLGVSLPQQIESEVEVRLVNVIARKKSVCNRKDPDTGQEQWLARIAYPGLRDLLNQYHKIKATPYP